jgi:iron complex outermembrane receptor protein
MKNRITIAFLISFLGLFSSISFAQNPTFTSGRISGKVVDLISTKPLEYSSVVLKNLKDSTILLGSLVDEKGFFEISKIPFGAYELSISYIGYKDFVQKPIMVIPPDKTDINVGTLKVEEDSKILQNVEITAERNFMQLNADKKIFNMDKNTMSTGGSAIDALKQVPTIDVDHEGKVSMRGSENIKVFINGKPSGITASNTNAILEAIPSSQIESIEIINNPSAKYEASGDAGIININLKKNAKVGLNGNFTIGYGTKYDANTGVSLNFRRNGISFSTSYNFRFRENYHGGNGQRYNMYPGKSPYYLNTNDYGTNHNFSNNFTTSIDYDFKDKNTLSFSTILSQSIGKGKSRLRTDFLDSLVDYIDAYNRHSSSKGLDWNADVNASYKRTFKSKTNDLIILGNYAYSNDRDKPIYKQQAVDINDVESNYIELYQRNFDYSTTHSGYVQADYTQPFDKIKSKLEIGYRWSMRSLNNELNADSLVNSTQQFVTDSSISNAYKYKEMINAAYAIFGGAVKKVMNYKVGMRVEYANISIDQKVGNQKYKQAYFDYFPSASMSFNLPKSHSLSISYSKRINRPHAHQLNPFGNYSDPYNILTGNPNLKPAYTHAIELNHFKNIDIKKSPKKDSTFHRSIFFSTTFYYRYSYNVFTRFNIIDSSGRSIVNFDNLNNGQNLGVEFMGRFSMFRWWNFMLSANLYQNKLRGNIPNGELDAGSNSFQYNLRLTNTFNINSKASLQMMVFYRSKNKFLQGTIKPMVFVNVGFKYDFLKDNRASIAININDIFHTQYFGVHTEGATYTNSVKRYWESTQGNIVFTYRFGKSETKNQLQKQKKSNFIDSDSGVEGGGGG